MRFLGFDLKMKSENDLLPGQKNLARGYASAIALVALTGALRATLMAGRATTTPFSFFYPAIAAASLIGGVGPGIAATILSGAVAILVNPEFPASTNWIFLAILAPIVIVAFSRLKQLRDRSAALAGEAHKLRFVVDRASDWILLVSEDNDIEYVNQTARSSLGYRPDELIGHKIHDLVDQAHRDRFADLLQKCHKGSVAPAESMWTRRDGVHVPVEVGFTSISIKEKSVVHVAARDITERKSIERKLREARQWEGLGSLAGGVAHDFNNLLTSIMGNASLARESLPSEHPAHVLVESIEVAGERSAELIRMMLATSGYKPRYVEIIRLDEALARILHEHPLPPTVKAVTSTEDASVESDRRSMETLLWSLISNAAESYAQSRGEVNVSIRSTDICGVPDTPAGYEVFEDGDSPNGPCAHITIEDRGCGMTREVLERAFDPFFTTKFTGRGLGLPAVRGIVRAHHGKLVVSTSPGAGTKVEIWLPVAGARYDVSASQ